MGWISRKRQGQRKRTEEWFSLESSFLLWSCFCFLKLLRAKELTASLSVARLWRAFLWGWRSSVLHTEKYRGFMWVYLEWLYICIYKYIHTQEYLDWLHKVWALQTPNCIAFLLCSILRIEILSNEFVYICSSQESNDDLEPLLNVNVQNNINVSANLHTFTPTALHQQLFKFKISNRSSNHTETEGFVQDMCKPN